MKQLIIVSAILAAAIAWWFTRPITPPVNTTRVTQPAPELKGETKQDIHPPQVPAYGTGTKKKLGLPAEVQDDPNKYVLGSAKLPNDNHSHTVTTVIDSQTGKTEIYDRRDPLPWLAAQQTGYVRISHGVRTGIGSVTRLSVSENLMSIKALHFGLDASLDSDGQAYAGAHVEYRW